MENLNWEDTEAVDIARQFFDKYISAWNPRAPSTSNQPNAWTNPEDPCLLSTPQIFKTNPFSDYEQLVNCVEHHTKCLESTCLRKNGSSLQCRYKAPWELHPKLALFIDSNGQRHTPLLTKMIDSIAITLPSYLFGVQMLTANQYSPYTLYKNISPNMHPKQEKNLKASTTCYIEFS